MTLCVTLAPFVEKGVTYEIGSVLELSDADIVRLGGAGLVRKAKEVFSPLPADCLVTVVVLLYRTEASEFRRWAETIHKSTGKAVARLEVVVVENTGAPYESKTANATIAKMHGFRYYRTERNLGFAAGANFGASKAKGDILVFLNDDMEFPDPWLDELTLPLRQDGKVAVAGADLQRPDGGDWSAFDRPDWVCGACFAVRTFEFRRFGGFDESYFFSWEETDYCRMVTNLGQRCVKTGAKIVHQGGETAEIVSDFARTHFERGRKIFDNKWSDKLRIVGTMLVGNERGRYLPESVEWLAKRCEKVVILDDASDDGTAEVLADFVKTYTNKIKVYRNAKPMFTVDEHLARESLHFKALKEAPTHIIPLDADETLSKRFDTFEWDPAKLQSLDFPIVHHWGDEKHRRVDGMWGQQSNVRFYRVDWKADQRFYCQPLHCGSAPIYAYERKVYRPDIALLHKGWMNTEDFERKKARNSKIDPSGYWEPQGHWFNDPVVADFEDDGRPDRDFNRHQL